MPDQVETVAETLGETLLWSGLGGGELIVALLVGLLLLAFAFPARLSDDRGAARRSSSPHAENLPQR